MSYWLREFGTTWLPTKNPMMDADTGAAKLLLLNLPEGGAFDVLGVQVAPLGTDVIEATFTINDVTAGAFNTTFYNLRALVGKRDRLYRWRDDGYVEWCWARCERVDARRSAVNRKHLDVTIAFVRVSATWYGEGHGISWTFDSGVLFDTGYSFDTSDTETMASSPYTATVTNGGNARILNLIMTITAGSADITALTIKRKVGSTTYEHLVYAETIASTKTLVIDCGARSVRLEGTDDYANFSLGADHKTDDWIRLLEGANSIEITFTGGSTNSTITFTFNDGWK